MPAEPVLLHFKFDNFANLPSDVESSVFSDEQFDDNCLKWKAELYPGGVRDAAKEGYIGLYLCSCNIQTIEAKFNLSIIDNSGSVCVEEESGNFDEFIEDDNWGWTEFMKRSDILDPEKKILKDGALCIDVTIQVKPRKRDIYQPPNPISAKMLKLLKSSEKADASFNVKGTTVMAHSLIVSANAPILANYCNLIPQVESGGSSDKPIQDLSPKVFQIILEFIYSGKYPTDKNAIKYGKELINAANKYDLVELKMAVENILVQERVITKKNVSEYIVFADSKCCPLLKEYALSFFAVHCKDVLKSEHSEILCESTELLKEIIILTGSSSDVGVASMSVSELRKELDKLELDVDGSKKLW
jgi:hypothetical protein